MLLRVLSIVAKARGYCKVEYTESWTLRAEERSKVSFGERFVAVVAAAFAEASLCDIPLSEERGEAFESRCTTPQHHPSYKVDPLMCIVKRWPLTA